MSRHRGATRLGRRWRELTAAVTAGVVLGALAGPMAAPARPVRLAASPPVSPAPSVDNVRTLTPHWTKPGSAPQPYRATATRWPGAASATIDLRSQGPGTPAAARVAGGGVPLWAQPVADAAGQAVPATLAVRMADHAAAQAAGVPVLAQVTPAADGGSGTVRIGIDYSGFAQAVGGNFGSRLRLVQLPGCAMTTPTVAACRTQTPLPSTNDVAGGTVSAPVTLDAARGSLVVAATSDPGTEGGAGGTYAATSLKPSGSWTQGGNSGSFTYSYPISVPSAASDLVPDIALSYDSGSVDGQTAGTGVQSSWVGDGWSAPESYVEQSFVACSDKPEGADSPKSTSDMCYDGPVLTLSLDGSSTSLVWDKDKKIWRAQDESGAAISHITDSGNGSGSYNTDYWQLTERDGTSYFFGRNRLPGWSNGKPATNSVNTEPVYSAHQPDPDGATFSDPCWKSAGFDASVCTMAWRWNLDYVVDVHGNAMAYYYHQDTNFYGRNLGATTDSYIRDSQLQRIDYGFVDGTAYGTVPNQVLFGVSPRCVAATCSPLNSTTAPNWPDVPYDLYCPDSSWCTNPSQGPSFFSTARLTSITTQQYNTATGGYQPVDSYALTQSMPVTADGHTSPTLWLNTVTHTGQDLTGQIGDPAAAPISLPTVTFATSAGYNLKNRVDTTSPAGDVGLYRYRLESITTETGDKIHVTYGQPTPCTVVPQDPASNNRSCFPVYWTPDGASQPLLDWFNKYVVTQVTEEDTTGGAPILQTDWDYGDGSAAWHYDTNEVVQAKYRSYGQWRGYGTVKTTTGDGTVADPKTADQTSYYRGMSKNNNSTVVNVTDSQGGQHEDLDQLAGKPLEHTSFLGNNGPVDNSTITSYWVSDPTATRARSGLPALTATWVQPVETLTRQAVTSTGTTAWRTTETDTSYHTTLTDANLGLPAFSYTHTVPADPAYDSCTTTGYTQHNTSNNLTGLVREAETDSVACGGFTEGAHPSVPAALNTLTAPPPATLTRPGQVVSDTLTFYDDPSFGTGALDGSTPTKGDVTMVRKAVDYSGSGFTYQTTARSVYDAYGRVTTAYDGNGNPTTTDYTMNSVGLTVATRVANALSQATTTTLAPSRGLTLTATDPNGVVTTSRYDALGRVSAVWLDSFTAPASPNYKYSYLVQNSGPTGTTAVTTDTLTDGGGYRRQVTIYDALLRPRQTQTNGHATGQSAGGRLLTDTFYDSHGWKRKTYNTWWDPNSDPTTSLATPAGNPDTAVTDEDFYSYDGLGRVVLDASARDGATISTTVTVYTGDTTTVIPTTAYTGQPSMVLPNTGGITQTTRTDPLGRSTELDQYTSPPTLHTPSNTFTGLWSVTGGTVAATRYGYDGHGNQATVTDPAGNTRTSDYNLLGQVIAKHDPDAGTSSMAYDGAGNLTQTTDGRGRAISYTYDPLGRKTGQYDAPTDQQADGNRLASWAYDNSNNVAGVTRPIGHLTTETAYRDGAAYTTQTTGFNIFGEPLGQTITIPDQPNTAGLAGSYTFSHAYTLTLGLPAKDIYPAAGGLPAETVTHTYKADAFDSPTKLGGGVLGTYVLNIDYDGFGRVNQETLGSGTNVAFITNTYDDHTSRLKDQQITRTSTTEPVDEQAYTYDLAGNITRQQSTRLGAATPTETQCFTYDTIARLTQAWTATDNCATTPTSSNHTMVGDSLGTASAYWTTWQLDDLGQRQTQTQHDPTGGPDTTTSYTYNGNSTGQPHTLTSTTTTGGTVADTSYSYDKAGNMTSRSTPIQGGQTLTWNDLGQLTAITGGSSGNVGYLYDADGNLVVENDPGSSTLYLPGQQITHNTTTGTTTGTRYYPLPGGGTTIRTGTTNTDFQFEITDQHATPTLYLDHTGQQPTWRQYTPYGQPRGTTNPWPDNHGYLNKPTNTTTGLDQLGARNYDPDTGRFISRDPLFNPINPQQLNGYTYTAANPITQTDPTGTRPCADAYSCDGPPSPPPCSCGEHSGNRIGDQVGGPHGTHQHPVICEDHCGGSPADEAAKNWTGKPFDYDSYINQELQQQQQQQEQQRQQEARARKWRWVAVGLSLASLAAAFVPLPGMNWVSAGLGFASAGAYLLADDPHAAELAAGAAALSAIPGGLLLRVATSSKAGKAVLGLGEDLPKMPAYVPIATHEAVDVGSKWPTFRQAAIFDKVQEGVASGIKGYLYGAAFCGPNPATACS